jgi:hypothetical protein
MGILPSPEKQKKATSSKQANSQIDFSNLGTLKKAGTKNFAGYRDSTEDKASPTFGKEKDKEKNGKRKEDDMDSDADDEEDPQEINDDEPTEAELKNKDLLSPEDAARQGELAEGVRKIKLKRQHSAEPLASSNSAKLSPTPGSGSPNLSGPSPDAPTSAKGASLLSEPPVDTSVIGSPLKKQRASLPGFEEEVRKSFACSQVIKDEDTDL